MKLLIILGTRPEVIKLSQIISEAEQNIELILVHTGQNHDYELNEIFFKELGIRKPDYFLNAVGKNVAETIANIIKKSDEVMEKEKPDALLVYGDTNSCLCVIPAKRRKIPIFHMEAGNRCFDMRVPEEINRKIVDHTSDVNMTITEHARRYLVSEGIRPETIFKVGSSLKEILIKHKLDISSSKILSRLKLKRKKYFLVSSHREENVDDEINLNNLAVSINRIANEYKLPIIFSTHPRTRKMFEIKKVKLNPNIRLYKPFGYFDYLKLQQNALCVLSDSGTITEESSLLSFPAINIRNIHERPEGMDEGAVIMSGLTPNGIMQSIAQTISNYQPTKNPFNIVKDYDVGNVSKKVVNIIISYTEYVNNFIWKKNSC